MKKKLIPLILALVCAIVCAFALVACDDTVAVESVALNETTLTLDVGDSTVLTATVKPDDAADKTVTWSSDKPDVATVDNVGKVEALAEGTATITAKTANNKSATCVVTVNAAPDDDVTYTAQVSATSWKYKENGATITVKDDDNNAVTAFTAKYITETDYNAIKDAADFKSQLVEKSSDYYADTIYVGTYYLFAELDAAGNADKVYSNFVKVTVNKGDLTINNAANLAAQYSYVYKIGKVKLSEISIENNYVDIIENGAHAVDADNQTVYGDFVWENPNDEVDCSDNGETRRVKFVPSDNNFDDTVTVDVTLTMKKGYVCATREGDGREKPEGEQGRTWDYYSPNGVAVQIDIVYLYKELVDITTNIGADTTIEIDEKADEPRIIDKIIGTWTPTYTFSLKDKVNYYWVDPNADGSVWEQDVTLHDVNNTEDKLLTFRVFPALQNDYSCALYADDSSINEEAKIKVWVGNPYNYDDTVGLTYQKDIQAQIVDSFTDKDGSYTTQVEATKEEVGYAADHQGHERAYVLISVTDLSKGNNLCIKITGSGITGYENVNKTQCIQVYGYNETITCPIASDAEIPAPTGTTVEELYNQYPTLVTPLGKWVLEMYYEGNWVSCKDTDALPEGSNQFKLVFVVSKGLVVGTPDAVEFAINGTSTPPAQG